MHETRRGVPLRAFSLTGEEISVVRWRRARRVASRRLAGHVRRTITDPDPPVDRRDHVATSRFLLPDPSTPGLHGSTSLRTRESLVHPTPILE